MYSWKQQQLLNPIKLLALDDESLTYYLNSISNFKPYRNKFIHVFNELGAIDLNDIIENGYEPLRRIKNFGYETEQYLKDILWEHGILFRKKDYKIMDATLKNRNIDITIESMIEQLKKIQFTIQDATKPIKYLSEDLKKFNNNTHTHQ